MTPFKVTIGRSGPSGPLGKHTIGPTLKTGQNHYVSKSKKGYTGTVAGLGRATGSRHGTVVRNGPGGPRRFAGAVNLGKRISAAPAAPKKQSIFARVAKRARAAAFGF
jgi:hypothetical protein